MTDEGGVQAAPNSLAATDTVAQLRRPCRYCDRTRPLVPIGSSRWWDMCARCARGLSNVQRRYELRTVPDETVPIDWAQYAMGWPERRAAGLALMAVGA